MSTKGQTEATPTRAVETQQPIETQPVVDPATVTADKMQSEVYKPPGQEGSRVDFNQAVITASFAPGSPESLPDPNSMGGDFKNYRTMMDAMWFGTSKMAGTERAARAFAGVGMLSMPDDKGLQCQTAGANGSECTYKASERRDGLSKLTRNKVDGTDSVTKEYQGRPDKLLNEKFFFGKDVRSIERNFAAGHGPNGLTSEKYSRSAATEGFERKYDPTRNPDKLETHTLNRKSATETESKTFQGRTDGLKREERITTAGSSSTEKLFEPNAANNGLQSENHWKSQDGKKSIEMKLFDPVQHKEKVKSENITSEGGVITVRKAFDGRSDGVMKETTEFTGLGAVSVRELADGTKQQRTLTPEQIKASGIDVTGLSTTSDAALRTKKALESGDTKLQQEVASGDQAVQEILKKTVGDKALNDPSFDGMTPPSQRDKAVMLIAAEVGYEGLRRAGMTVNEQTSTATTADGFKYTFAKKPDGKLQTTSVESEKNERKIEFQYREDGALKGSIETAKITDAPAGVENGAGRKYENLELPAIQKGWGPYQALQQMQREGKIQMSPQEMRQEAVRIRDREFARLGRNYFKVGETFSMYSPEEMAGQSGERSVKIHRDAAGNLQKMERGDKAIVNFGYDETGKPSRVSDGIGPDLISKDGGHSWEFENKRGTVNRGLTPAIRGKIAVQPDKGTITVTGEDNLKFTIGADGTRTYTAPDGKEMLLFRPPVPVAAERNRTDRGSSERGRERGRTPRGREGITPASSQYDEGGVVKRGDSTPHQRGRGKPGPDGTIAQTYINQENSDPQMRAVRNPQSGPEGSMKLRGSPTISAEKIDQLLREARSPAAKERIRDQDGKEITFGQHLYKLGVEYGVDPALTLAFFKQESGYGKAGAAARNNSVGNIKGDGGFRQYGSFAEGARDWFKLMQDGTYYFRQGRDTVGRVMPKYAPGNDGNDVGGYIRGVERNVRQWSRESAHAPERAAEFPAIEPTTMRRETGTPVSGREVTGERVIRDISDRSKFYAYQNDGHSCSAFSMAMMAGDHLLGRPPQYGQETQSFKKLAGVLNHGYRGSLETMAGQLRQVGLEAKAYQYNRFGQQGMQDLNAELDKGHSAVARVINPHTGNRHYIYVAGRNAEGNYILGDPDRGNPSHAAPVSPQRLMKMMSGRDGFVAGWAASDGPAKSVPGTAGYKRAQAMR